MWKNLLILALIGLGIAYVIADKPITHTVETKDSTGRTTRLTINVLVGAGNTINYNDKDAS